MARISWATWLPSNRQPPPSAAAISWLCAIAAAAPRNPLQHPAGPRMGPGDLTKSGCRGWQVCTMDGCEIRITSWEVENIPFFMVLKPSKVVITGLSHYKSEIHPSWFFPCLGFSEELENCLSTRKSQCPMIKLLVYSIHHNVQKNMYTYIYR